MKGFSKFIVLLLFIGFLLPMDYAGKGEKRDGSPILEARKAESIQSSSTEKSKSRKRNSLKNIELL